MKYSKPCALLKQTSFFHFFLFKYFGMQAHSDVHISASFFNNLILIDFSFPLIEKKLIFEH